MTDVPRPWWYSGDDQDGPPGPADSEEAPTSAMDWTALVSGAQRLVDWATSTVMAPHADHDDPREHPSCVVCRTILLLGDRPTESADAPKPAPSPAEIVWIPILGDGREP